MVVEPRIFPACARLKRVLLVLFKISIFRVKFHQTNALPDILKKHKASGQFTH